MTGATALEIVRRRLIVVRQARMKFGPLARDAMILKHRADEASEILSLLEAFEREGKVEIGGEVFDGAR